MPKTVSAENTDISL